MWCRFLTFCVLVSFILFVVASCIYGRPSFHLFFHRCCGDDIENDQVIFENFGSNFLKERLVGGNIIEADSEIVFENEDIGRITDEPKELSINDPEVKKWIADTHITDRDTPDGVEDKTEDDEKHDMRDKEEELLDEGIKDVTASTESAVIIEKETEKQMYVTNIGQEKYDLNKKEVGSFDNDAEVAEMATKIVYLNVHDYKHKQLARTI